MKIDAETSRDRRGAGWRAVTLLVLLAFTLQSFVTQTHLHPLPAAVSSQISLGASHHGNSPLDDSAATCPFCQATVHAGAFFAPGFPILLLPAWTAIVESVSTAAKPFERAIAHDWHSRAPPRQHV